MEVELVTLHASGPVPGAGLTRQYTCVTNETGGMLLCNSYLIIQAQTFTRSCNSIVPASGSAVSSADIAHAHKIYRLRYVAVRRADYGGAGRLRGTNNSTPRLDLSKPRYDQSVFSGRLRHFMETANPLNVLVPSKRLEDAAKLVTEYRL